MLPDKLDDLYNDPLFCLWLCWIKADWRKVLECSKNDSVTKIWRDAFLVSGSLRIGNDRSSFKMLESSSELLNILIADTHSSLARCNVLLGRDSRAAKHFHSFDDFLLEKNYLSSFVGIRKKYELIELGFPEWWLDESQNISSVIRCFDFEMDEKLLSLFPNSLAILIGLAERSFYRKDYSKSIIYWQKAAAVMQDDMPGFYYQRLEESYELLGRFPYYGEEEERVSGVYDKHLYIENLHKRVKPKRYLEIGVESGRSLLLADCIAFAVDPMPKKNIKLKENHKLYKVTSDVFFRSPPKDFEEQTLDLVFIDGMHLFEYAMRDFINVEKYCHRDTLVIVDDVFPGHPLQANRDRKTRHWTGDVWKFSEILRHYRKDLDIEWVDIYPTGLMLIKNLDPGNNVLSKNFDDIVSFYIERTLDFDFFSNYVNRELVNH